MQKYFSLTYVLLLVLLFVLAACKSEDSSGSSPINAVTLDYSPQHLAQSGGVNFSIYCVACHGKDAKGLQGLGVNLVESNFVASHNDEELLAFIKQGRPQTSPENKTGVTMPAKGGFPNLTDQQLRSIIAFLRQLQANK